MGHDGNLYGTAVNPWDLVYQLKPSQSGWRMKILYSFKPELFHCDYFEGQELTQDAAGNLVGIANWWRHPWGCIGPARSAALEYQLSPSANGWTYSIVQLVETDPNWYNDSFHGLAVDGNGNSYVAGITRVYDFCDYYLHCSWYVGGGYLNIDYVDQEFSASGLVVDAPGNNLYGITWDCGQYDQGTVWHLATPPTPRAKPESKQLSP